MYGVLLDIGEIVTVSKMTTAIFFEVKLRHYVDEAGDRVVGRVRWISPYHGAGFGEWWIPDVGLDVLCFFPGVAPHGEVNDLDEGFAFGVVSTKTEPPVEGLVADLSATRRVEKGKSGVDLDQHLQGALDRKVDGAETAENVGIVSRTFRAAASWLGDQLMRFHSETEVQIDAPLVKLGDVEAVKKIVHEEFVALFNAHVHSGVDPGAGASGPPTVSMGASHISEKTRVDAT